MKEPLLITGIKTFEDNRGVFFESYKESIFRDKYNLLESFVQDNHSVSCKNTIRGMHYQWDKPMGKLIRVAKGKITDVIVDIRKNSKDFGRIYYYELDDQNNFQLYVPPGFGHGFICRSEEAIVIYKCTAEYNKEGESGINPFDKDLKINWGISYNEAVISQKDANSITLQDYKKEAKF